jgi:hypothetical protein
MHPSRSLFAALSLFVALGTASSALAQAPAMTPAPGSPPAEEAPPPAVPPVAQPTRPPAAPPPGSPPVPSSAMAPNGEYVAPMSQTTQPVYIPQSVALSGPRMLKDWQEGQPIPYGYHREERMRKGPIIVGSIVFGVPYLYSALIASVGADVSSGDNRAAALFLPVLGPFIELHESSSVTIDYLLILDGLAQATGAALFIYGVTSPRPVLVRNDLAMVTLTPARLGRDGTGLLLTGRF